MHARPSAIPAWALAAAALAACVAGLLALSGEAEASHFRGGTMYAVPDDADPLKVTFEGRIAFRCSAFSGSGCPLGSVYSGGGIEIFSDLSTTAGPGFYMKVVAYNAAKDWFQSVVTDASGNPGVPYTFPSATPPGGGGWHFAWSSSARLSAVSGAGMHHVNNPDHSWRLEGDVVLGNNPPRPVVPPIVQCRKDLLCEIDIPFTDADAGDPIDFRFAESCEAQGTTAGPPYSCTDTGTTPFYQPSDPLCTACGLTTPAYFDVAARTLNWNTTGATYFAPPDTTYYSTQVMLEDSKVKVPMDFFIEIVEAMAIMPVWDPPTKCDGVVTVMQGSIARVPVRASSADPARIVTILALEYPTGATFATTAGNPAVGTLTWDTTGYGLGDHLAIFLASDDLGYEAPPCAITLRIVKPPVLDFSFYFTETSPLDLTYDPVQFNDESIIEALPDRTIGWSWDFDDPLGATVGFGPDPTHEFADGGARPDGDSHLVCMFVTLDDAGSMWTGSVCKPVVVFNRPPDASVRAKPTALRMHVEGRQMGYDMDGTIVRRTWDWGDGQVTDGPAVMGHLYGEPGTYRICVTAYDDDGDLDVACREIVIADAGAPADFDRDGVSDDQDNCVDIPNREQADADLDGEGDLCEEAPAPAGRTPPTPSSATPEGDQDADGVADAQDNCPAAANTGQADLDLDGAGDACDVDRDGDGLAMGVADTFEDNCPGVANPDQSDADGDGEGDACEGLASAPAALASAPVGAGAAPTPTGRAGPGWPVLAAVAAALAGVGLVAVVAVRFARRA